MIAGILFLFELVCNHYNFPESKQLIPTGWTYRSNNSEAEDFNQYGFRGKPIPPGKKAHQKWILLLGDSQIESLGLDDSLQMEHLLERKINPYPDSVEYVFFTAGTGGYGQDQQLMWLERILKKHPFDMVVLWFTPENDVWNNMFPTHWPWNGTPKPTFVLNNKKLSLELDTIKYELNSALKLLVLFEKIALDKKYSHLDDLWSTTYLPVNEIITYDTSLSKKTTEWIGEQEQMNEQKTHLLLYTEKNTKRLQYGLELTKALLDSMKNLCAGHHADLKIFVAENHFYDHMHDGKWMYDDHLQSFFKVSKTSYQRRLEALLNPFGGKIFSLKTKDKRISEQDTYHLNRAAQQELADSLQKWIIRDL